MSTSTPLDSDLYGDIYGEEENEYAVPLDDEGADGEDIEEDGTLVKEEYDQDHEPQTSEGSRTKTNVTGGEPNSLGPDSAKPPASHGQGSSTAPSSALSYSAQIAQQFSSYQQTPSQERQQRSIASKMAMPQPPSPAADSVFGKKPSEMHDAGKLFIGGLNWDTTDEGLRDYFSQFGKVDACTIMRDPKGTSRGFAFLTFEDPNAVNGVIGKDHVLDGKQIDPKRAIPREEHLRNTRYFVGGLAPNSTVESMKEFFSQYGKVVDATVMVDRDSGRSKGFGFVTFEDASNTDQLVGKAGLILDEKQIEVKMAQPRSQRDQNRGDIVQNFADATQNRNTPMNVPFTPQQLGNPMAAMMLQRGMNQMPMMGGMPMMGMNPMAMMGMGMGMGGMNGMMGGMMGGGMGAGMMSGMGGMGASMGNMGPMRMGMGPMGGAAAAMGGVGMGGMGAMAGNMGGMVGMAGMGMNRMGMNAGGAGPARVSSRGQHSFHPYAR